MLHKSETGSLRGSIETAIEILRAEGDAITVASIGDLVKEKFPDVLEENRDALIQAGWQVLCRRSLKISRRRDGLGAADIQMAFGFGQKLPEFISLPDVGEGIFPWRHLSDCRLPEIDRHLRELRRQALDDKKHRIAVREFRKLFHEATVRFGRPDLTVAEAVRLLS